MTDTPAAKRVEPQGEGEPCPECGVPVDIAHHGDGCTCFMSAPCSYCVDTTLECKVCGWGSEQP
jgi:hypothetical protein